MAERSFEARARPLGSGRDVARARPPRESGGQVLGKMAAGDSRLAGATLGPREGHMTRLAARAAGAEQGEARGVASHVAAARGPGLSSDFAEARGLPLAPSLLEARRASARDTGRRGGMNPPDLGVQIQGPRLWPVL